MTPLQKHTLIRLPKIQQGLRKGLTIKQIAAQCNVYEKTIDRDLKAWLQSGEFDLWLREEFLRLHTKVSQEDEIEAYKQISNLVKASLTRKIEQKVDATVQMPGLAFEHDTEIRELLRKASEQQKAEHDAKPPTA